MRRSDKKKDLKRILVRERTRRVLTQEEVAEAIGAPLRNYQRWERGENFPQEYYLRKLREFFGPGIDVVILSDKSEDELHAPPPSDSQEKIKDNRSSGSRKYPPLPLILIILILIFFSGIAYVLHITHPYGFRIVKPGGAWISPAGPTVGNVVRFEAYAYPTYPGDPAIDYVNFTAYWQGVDPRAWAIACQARFPVHKDVYACDANLQQLGASPGQITISFDVYDRQGNVNFAPNGEHKAIYSPG